MEEINNLEPNLDRSDEKLHLSVVSHSFDKDISNEIDFLWKGDRSMLITMWLCILLALAELTELGFNIYFTFFN